MRSMETPINLTALSSLLGIPGSTPLTTREMNERLQVYLYPPSKTSGRLQCFVSSLSQAFRVLGVRLLSRKEAIRKDGTFRPGIVVIAPGDYPDDELAINRVSALYNTIIVGIHDMPAPLHAGSSTQNKLDAIVSRLAWDMVHISIYLDDDSWTVCTMNGGVVELPGPCPLPSDIQATLVPKLAAQVVPPRPSDINFLPGTLASTSAIFSSIADDFTACARLWRGNDYLLTHTSRESLHYRSAFYRKVVARYLDQRSGMSYGFFARQLPQAVPPAIPCETAPAPGLTETPDDGIAVRVLDSWYRVKPAAVTVITTRSGCRKTQLDPATDLVSITLDNGRITFRTGSEHPDSSPARPSFDTLTILAHALGNTFIASLLKTLRPSWNFPGDLASKGASMTHWHGYPQHGQHELISEGYFTHGEHNPPVSCSTPQSAAYSLLGKLEALEASLKTGRPYRGDIHIEPHHGTNIVGSLDLAQTARLLNG
ncbi:hypothetical protein [Prosthecochloris ethylica]